MSESSRKKSEKDENRVIEFFKGVRVELSKVTWPTRERVINDTLIVIAGSLVVALFLGSLDFVFSYLLETVIL